MGGYKEGKAGGRPLRSVEPHHVGAGGALNAFKMREMYGTGALRVSFGGDSSRSALFSCVSNCLQAIHCQSLTFF